MNDEAGDTTFAIERTYLAAKEVYVHYLAILFSNLCSFTLLNATNNLRIQYRWGDHHGADDPDELFDWTDNSFKRGQYTYPMK